MSNRGGGLGEYKKSLSENTKTFLTQGGGLGEYKKSLTENTKTFLTEGGSYPIQKGFFGIIYQKRFFFKKMAYF